MPSHSNELEHRITVNEVRQDYDQKASEERWSKADKQFAEIKTRMSWLEKTVLAILGLLQVVLQDKYPKLASILKGLM